MNIPENSRVEAWAYPGFLSREGGYKNFKKVHENFVYIFLLRFYTSEKNGGGILKP